MRFTLTIELGNDRMKVPQNIYDSIRFMIESEFEGRYDEVVPAEGSIIDFKSGGDWNEVGEWRIEDTE